MKIFFKLTIFVFIFLTITGCEKHIESVSNPQDNKEDKLWGGEEFNRKNLIEKVSNGDADAAYRLANHYIFVERIPEAAVYWLKKAKNLGCQDFDDFTITSIENGILQAPK